MVTFGELRKLSAEWQMDIAAVERVYVLDWLLKSVFEEPSLGPVVALRGPAALSKAYFAEYPQPEDADLASREGPNEPALRRAAEGAARQSGVSLRLTSIHGAQARFEYTGPLGRRSAAQPHVTLRFHPFALKVPPRERPLLHPFKDRVEALVQATALEEMTAGYLVAWSSKPRARDVFDLWFILTRRKELELELVRSLGQALAAEKGVKLARKLDSGYRPLLERAWENALKNLQPRPRFQEAEADLEREIGLILA